MVCKVDDKFRGQCNQQLNDYTYVYLQDTTFSQQQLICDLNWFRRKNGRSPLIVILAITVEITCKIPKILP